MVIEAGPLVQVVPAFGDDENRLLAAKVSEQELKAIDAEVRNIVNGAAEFAQSDPEPAESELWTDVLVSA